MQAGGHRFDPGHVHQLNSRSLLNLRCYFDRFLFPFFRDNRDNSGCGVFRQIESVGPLLQCLQILDNLHTLLFGELAADHAVAYRTVVEFMPGVRVAGHIGAELLGAL